MSADKDRGVSVGSPRSKAASCCRVWVFLFRVIFNLQGCDSLLESGGSTSGADGALPAEAGSPHALQTQGDMHSVCEVIVVVGVSQSSIQLEEGRRKNKMADVLDMFSALLRLLESNWFKSHVSKITFPSFMEYFRHGFCRPSLGYLNLGEPMERLTELLSDLKYEPVISTRIAQWTMVLPLLLAVCSVSRSQQRSGAPGRDGVLTSTQIGTISLLLDPQHHYLSHQPLESDSLGMQESFIKVSTEFALTLLVSWLS